MPNWITTGIIAGLVAAAMQGSFTLSPITALLFYLSPLPLFIAGFSRGMPSALLGTAISASLVFVLIGSATFALMSVVSAGLAPIIASRLSMISRNASQNSSEGEARSKEREWYPEGRLVLWLAAIATIVTGLSILAIGTDFETYKAFITRFVDGFVSAFEKQMPAGQPPFPKEIFSKVIVTALPVAVSAAWLLATISTMRIAIVVLTNWKMSLRPWSRFGQLAFPANSVIALVAALIGAYFLSGIAQLLALGAVGAFVTAFTVLGLAIVHGLLAGNVARPLLLGLIYGALLLFNWLAAIPLTVLGLADLNFNFRKSKAVHT